MCMFNTNRKHVSLDENRIEIMGEKAFYLMFAHVLYRISFIYTLLH